jgi:hypothetical protein
MEAAMRTFMTAAAFTVATLALGTGSASAQHGGRAGHIGGHAGGHIRAARPVVERAGRPGLVRPLAGRPHLVARGATALLARRPNGVFVDGAYVAGGVVGRHGTYGRAWRGYTRRLWYRPAGAYIYWSPTDGGWYQWTAAEQVFVPVETLTAETPPPADVADAPPPPPPQ